MPVVAATSATRSELSVTLLLDAQLVMWFANFARSGWWRLLSPEANLTPTCPYESAGYVSASTSRATSAKAVSEPSKGQSFAPRRRAGDDLLPSRDGSLTDLIRPQRPKERAGRAPRFRGPFASLKKRIHRITTMSFENVILTHGRRGTLGIEGPIHRNLTYSNLNG
jgi:hypothetical protein